MRRPPLRCTSVSRGLPGRIGVNAIFLEPPMGGLETYVRALLPELVRIAPGIRFSVFCGPRGHELLQTEDWSGEVELVTHPLFGARGLKAISEMTVLGAIAGRRVDLLYSVALTAPLKTRAANVVLLADVTWIVFGSSPVREQEFRSSAKRFLRRGGIQDLVWPREYARRGALRVFYGHHRPHHTDRGGRGRSSPSAGRLRSTGCNHSI